MKEAKRRGDEFFYLWFNGGVSKTSIPLLPTVSAHLLIILAHLRSVHIVL
jgi:hypothetical protein